MTFTAALIGLLALLSQVSNGMIRLCVSFVSKKLRSCV
jgi:hypothetical protein